MSKSVFVCGLILGTGLGVLATGIVPRGENSHLAQSQISDPLHPPQGRCLQSYPNMKGRILLENDEVIVQRFTFPPGVWEGVHAHPANQLYIYLTDAAFKVRYGDRTTSGRSPAGAVGWCGPVDMSEDHESVNIGEDPVELIWVTLQEGCEAT